jgi:ABC-2 type transport system permease protein
VHKVWTIAWREYRAAVQTKAFILSLLLVPLIAALSIGLQLLIAKAENAGSKTYAVIDRTRQLRPALEAARERHNAIEIYDVETKLREAPAFTLVFVEPSADSKAAIVEQRLDLSQRQMKGEFEGLLEIGPEVFTIVPPGSPPDDRHDVRFQSEKAVERDFPRWANRVVSNAVQEQRFMKEGISPEAVRTIQTPAPLRLKGLTKKNRVTGAIEDASDDSRVMSFLLPTMLVVLMMVLVMLGAIPAMQGVVEEKQQRIAEVLLGCVSPFALMLGKLLGVMAVSLTMSAVYLGGGYAIAARYGVTTALTPTLLAWFMVFLVLAVLIYGSLFMAVGAAAADIKDTQSLQMPLMMLVCVPTALLGVVVRDPAGKVAQIGSMFPFSAPMLMTARLGSPAEVAWWQPWVAATGVLAMSLGCVWAAGRIFRVGLLVQGGGVRFADLAKWIVRG